MGLKVKWKWSLRKQCLLINFGSQISRYKPKTRAVLFCACVKQLKFFCVQCAHMYQCVPFRVIMYVNVYLFVLLSHYEF